MPVNKRRISLSAIGAERLFVANIFVLMILLGANFVLATNMLKAQRSAVVKKKTDVKILNEESTAIKSVEQYLTKNKDVITKTRSTMANVGFSSDYDTRVAQAPRSDSATFQEQFIYDVQNYAKQANISVIGYSFPDGGAPTGASVATPTTNTASGSSGGATTTEPVAGPKIPSSVQANNISISFGNDGKIPYGDFMKFLSLLEQNTTRMYIASIELTPDDTGTQIVQGSMEITIFSRKSS
jgi:hypothetical protein